MKRVELPGAVIINADCREAMAAMEPDSIDAIVCDPPYGLEFMGKAWDHGVPGVPFWAEALRVLKPGGHLLAFGGTRTYHRLAVAIEDAGFEVRDCLSWMYGSGFPKSLDVSKAIDKMQGNEREVVGKGINYDAKVKHGGTWTGGVYAQDAYTGATGPLITAPGSQDSAQWQGWGTALKPAWEPIVMARKPLIGTVAKNVLTHGTGALNIDATRIGHSSPADLATSLAKNPGRGDTFTSGVYGAGRPQQSVNTDGRWPANVMLSHDDECVQVGEVTERVGGGANASKTATTTVDFAEGYERGDGWVGGEITSAVWECEPDCPVLLLDEQSGIQKSGVAVQRNGGGQAIFGGLAEGENTLGARADVGYADKGGASRFFYSSKVSKKERNAGMPEGKTNSHPTVKPVAVMAWLVKLVTPPGGTVLDPFMGSGSTGIAAVQEGFEFIGVDNDTEHGYCNIAWHRIKHAIAQKDAP